MALNGERIHRRGASRPSRNGSKTTLTAEAQRTRRSQRKTSSWGGWSFTPGCCRSPRLLRPLRLCGAFIVVAVLLTASQAADTGFALTGCRVITGTRDEIASGIVVVKDGRIESVAPWVKGQEPAGVDVIDATGKVLAPAFVHPATRLGLRDDVPGGDDTVEPLRTAATELNPWLPANAWSAANGFATLGLLPSRGVVGGRGVAVRSAAAAVESMMRRDDAFLRCDVASAKFSTSFPAALAEARKDIEAQTAYDKALADWTAAKAKAEAEKQPVPKEPDKVKAEPSRDAYRKVLRGEMTLLLTVESSTDAHVAAVALADERVRGRLMRIAVVANGDTYRAAGELADLGATCIVRAGLVTWPNSTDRVCPAVVLRNAGCRVALVPRDDSRAGLADFPLALAQTVRAGFPRADALRAVTSVPAEVLGLGEDTGTIAKGRRADLVLWSADPIGAAPRIERMWIDGAVVDETP